MAWGMWRVACGTSFCRHMPCGSTVSRGFLAEVWLVPDTCLYVCISACQGVLQSIWAWKECHTSYPAFTCTAWSQGAVLHLSGRKAHSGNAAAGRRPPSCRRSWQTSGCRRMCAPGSWSWCCGTTWASAWGRRTCAAGSRWCTATRVLEAWGGGARLLISDIDEYFVLPRADTSLGSALEGCTGVASPWRAPPGSRPSRGEGMKSRSIACR